MQHDDHRDAQRRCFCGCGPASKSPCSGISRGGRAARLTKKCPPACGQRARGGSGSAPSLIIQAGAGPHAGARFRTCTKRQVDEAAARVVLADVVASLELVAHRHEDRPGAVSKMLRAPRARFRFFTPRVRDLQVAQRAGCRTRSGRRSGRAGAGSRLRSCWPSVVAQAPCVQVRRQVVLPAQDHAAGQPSELMHRVARRRRRSCRPCARCRRPACSGRT